MAARRTSSSRNTSRYLTLTSTSTFAPSLRCSSMVSRPPEKAYLLILVAICLAVSVMKMALVGSEALILLFAPRSAGKNLLWITAGFRYPSGRMRGATSRVMRKNGSWSMPQGISTGTCDAAPNMSGKEEENDGAAWMAEYANLPVLSSRSRPRAPIT
eukprot:Mycagemm_TRINITY_DN10307_c2_g4::TRINITY_DN10307_c2_g4_i1::g.427::m.427 type:complete len:158 gc:universal TRINITY_DN10307_c2_g4_i1:1033-560(-)